MQVFVMRHGEAEPKAKTDASRRLTPQGMQDVQQMIHQCHDELACVDQIWASPFIRAQQTAELVSTLLDTTVLTRPWLTPEGNPTRVMDELQAVSHDTILLVSHQPLVGTFIDSLAGLEIGRYRMGTSALACIDVSVYARACGELRWLHQAQTCFAQ